MRFLYTLSCWLLLTYSTAAQVQVNDLQGLLDYADDHAVAARQSKLQPMIAAQDVKLQASGLYPKINAFSTGDYYPLIPTQVIPAEVLGGKPGTYYKAQFGLPYVFTAGAEISMPIINLEKWTQLSKARVKQRQAEWSSKTALETFHIQLIQTYYQSLATKEVLKLNDEKATVADELLRILDGRYKAGVLNPSDYNRGKNLVLDVQAANIGYKRSLSQNNNNLRALLSIDDNDSLQVNEKLTDFKWTVLQSGIDASQRPAWKEADTKVIVAELSLAESKRGALPKLNANGRYAYNFQSKLESGSNNVEFNVANIGLRLDVPLFQGNYYRSLQRKSNLELSYAKLEQERTRTTLHQQQDDWQEQYRAAFDKQQVLQLKMDAATENLRIARLNIQEGVMEFDEFNNIFAEYNRSKMDYLQNLADGILYYLLSTQNF